MASRDTPWGLSDTEQDGHIDLLFYLHVLYSWPEISVSAITQKVPTGFSSNYIYRVSLPISSSSSLRGHIDLVFDLLYFRPEMSVGAINYKVPIGFSPNYTFRFFSSISSSSSLRGHIDQLYLLRVRNVR